MNFSREEWFFFSGIVFTGVATTHNDIHHVRVTNSERRRILEIIGEEEEEEVPELEDVNF